MLSATDKPNFFIICKLTFNSWAIYRRCKIRESKEIAKLINTKRRHFIGMKRHSLKMYQNNYKTSRFCDYMLTRPHFLNFSFDKNVTGGSRIWSRKCFDIRQTEECARKCQESKPKCLGMTPETLVFIALKCVLSLLIVRFPFYNKSFMSNFIYWWLIRNTYAIF